MKISGYFWTKIKETSGKNSGNSSKNINSIIVDKFWIKFLGYFDSVILNKIFIEFKCFGHSRKFLKTLDYFLVKFELISNREVK